MVIYKKQAIVCVCVCVTVKCYDLQFQNPRDLGLHPNSIARPAEWSQTWYPIALNLSFIIIQIGKISVLLSQNCDRHILHAHQHYVWSISSTKYMYPLAFMAYCIYFSSIASVKCKKCGYLFSFQYGDLNLCERCHCFPNLSSHFS